MVKEITIDVPLSAAGVKAALKSLKALSDDIKNGGFDEKFRSIAADMLFEELQDNIAAIIDPDGNLTGTLYPPKHIFGISQIKWSGDQVVFLEFGTGISGIENPYPDATIMALVGYEYHQFHGITGTEWWSYRDRVTEEYETTFGIAAQAPMYTVFLEAPSILDRRGFKERVADLLEGMINTAFGVK